MFAVSSFVQNSHPSLLMKQNGTKQKPQQIQGAPGDSLKQSLSMLWKKITEKAWSEPSMDWNQVTSAVSKHKP